LVYFKIVDPHVVSNCPKAEPSLRVGLGIVDVIDDLAVTQQLHPAAILLDHSLRKVALENIGVEQLFVGSRLKGFLSGYRSLRGRY